MFTRYNLVQFEDNTYGVLKTTCGLFKSFVDLVNPQYSRSIDTYLFDENCKAAAKDFALEILKQKTSLNTQ
jgi:hypothetical protein